MIFADKLIRLRKQAGLSQEELAEQMQVSRQAVSKWESAQTVPDLERILQLAALFGVTTDYLLKDSEEQAEYTAADTETAPLLSLQQASEYLALRDAAAGRIALGILLCILSPVMLILLGAAAEYCLFGITENVAGAAGLITLFCMVAAAVVLLCREGMRHSPWEFLETAVFRCEYGVEGMVRRHMQQLQPQHERYTLAGVVLCVLAPIFLFVGLLFNDEFILIALLCCMLVCAGAGVYLLVAAGVRKEACERLLQQGDYTEKAKAREQGIGSVYWPLVTAVYLGWSFLSGSWHISWVVWPVAAVAYSAVCALVELVRGKR
ncbi:MAG: helix-turn-helix transcriptional regulator [Oscillospiraceae bacterium]|nr:helix-turn-helix transcriptional regulator [Oscillospiraceae bacterium]